MADTPRIEPLLTLAEVAEILAVPVANVRRRIWAGELASIKVGRKIRIRPADLQSYLDGSGPDSHGPDAA